MTDILIMDDRLQSTWGIPQGPPINDVYRQWQSTGANSRFNELMKVLTADENNEYKGVDYQDFHNEFTDRMDKNEIEN